MGGVYTEDMQIRTKKLKKITETKYIDSMGIFTHLHMMNIAIPTTTNRDIPGRYFTLIADVAPSTTKYMLVNTPPANIRKI